MKRIILTVAAVFAFGFANAQDKSASSDAIKFGVKGGVQFTNFAGDDADGLDGKTGFYIGGLADFTVSEKFHVQPELLFSTEGAEEDGFDLGLSYLRLPIMAKYYVMEGLNIQAGPEVAFKVAAAEDLFDDSTKSVDFGLGFGAGYEMASGLMFDARYNLGLSNIADYEDGDLKNTGFQVGLGYRF
ncbi:MULTISPECIES: porin family protein [Flavobacterium]|uniref:porin family protein n=1 Tax=Flavobacterium TaxID=237 RepID=UPI001FCB32F1|nr:MULTISPECIES: porin family protein [Flavobacterium]UOK42493.1 PorT family protein [Flavobacterium enshiense]